MLVERRTPVGRAAVALVVVALVGFVLSPTPGGASNTPSGPPVVGAPTIAVPATAAAARAGVVTPPGPVCAGTGSDGPRVQAVYAYTSTPPTGTQLADIATYAAVADQVFADSAARTGGDRRVRWVTDGGSAGCAVAVTARLITTVASGFRALRADLTAQGLTDVNRKYLVWTEGRLDTPQTEGCGVGEFWADDGRNAATNFNATNAAGTPDATPTFAAFDNRCWNMNGGHSVPSHELMHMLGAVQNSAPNRSGDGHCTDDYDAMCYGPTTVIVAGCSDPSDERLFDCNNDDYFSTDPVRAGYLCTNWNTARSPYLWNSTVDQPPRPVVLLSAVGEPGSVRISWSASPSCVPPDSYIVSVTGSAPVTVGGDVTSVTRAAPSGSATVTVFPSRAGVAGPSTTTSAVVPDLPPPPPPPPPADRAPVGELLMTKVDRRTYGILGYAIDPDTDAPIQVVVDVAGVGPTVVTADYRLDGLPQTYPGYGPNHGFVFRTSLPPGTRDVCVYALGANGGAGSVIGCQRITVK